MSNKVRVQIDATIEGIEIREIRVDFLSNPKARVGFLFSDQDGQLNESGIKLMTEALVGAIVGHIKGSHHHGTINECDHMRYAIDLLNAGFVESHSFVEDIIE